MGAGTAGAADPRRAWPRPAGAFDPFARTRRERNTSGDPRPSIAERYTGRSDYLRRVSQASDDLVRQRFLLAADAPAVLERAKAMWSAVADAGTATPPV